MWPRELDGAGVAWDKAEEPGRSRKTEGIRAGAFAGPKEARNGEIKGQTLHRKTNLSRLYV